MGRKKNAASQRELKAAEFLFQGPFLTTSQAMKAANYSTEEANNKTCQKRVRRVLFRLQNKKKATEQPEINIVIAQSNLEPSLSPLTTSTAPSSSSSSSRGPSSADSSKKKVIDGIRQPRWNASQKQILRNNDRKTNDAENSAVKEATVLYAAERKKPRKDPSKIGARAICGKMDAKHGTSLCPRRVEMYVKQGKIGVSPEQRGQRGKIPLRHYKHLLVAFSTFVQIKQSNGEGSGLSNSKLKLKVNSVVTPVGEQVITSSKKLLERCLRDSRIDLKAENRTPV